MIGITLSLVGITLDIIGAILLFKYGFASDMLRVLHLALKEKSDSSLNKSKNLAEGKSRLGFWFLIFGFSFQFLGTIWPVVFPQKPEVKCNYNRNCQQHYPQVAHIRYSY